jgi:hypothetical protein
VDAVIFRRAVAEDILAIVTLQQEGGVLGLSHIFPQDSYPFPREETSADGIPNRRSHGGSI